VPKVHVNGIDINYLVQGEGYPLVLAHGYTASLEMWENQVEALSRKYKVVVYDSRGHGESDAPADAAQYSMDHYLEDQRALMEHLGIEEAYVGGLSMGGMIAMRFALRYPQMIRALLLCDTAAALTGPVSEDWERAPADTVARVRADGVAAVMAQLNHAWAQAGYGPQGPPPPAVQRHVERLARMTPDGFLGAGKAVREQRSVLDRLGEIKAPTLILVGDKDLLLAPSRAMQERLPGCQFVLIGDSYHGTCLWQPEAFTTAVLDFLARVDAGEPVTGEREL
jgi:pimeloyl-ACP methyl ester carboxylesterase